MVELPHLTWFDQIPLADLWLSGTIKIQDLFTKYGEHGMLGTNILYLVNTSLFHGSTMFDVIINDINVIICGFCIIFLTQKSLAQNNKFKVLIAISQCIFLFSGMQGSSGGMETQVRLGLLFLLLSMVLIDKEFRQKDVSWKRLVGICLFIFLSINVFGTLYSFAGLPLIWIIMLFYIVKKQGRVTHFVISAACVVTIPIYIFEYRLMTAEGMRSLGGNRLLEIFNLPNFFKGLCAWNANAVLGWAYHESNGYSSNLYLAIGATILVITVLCIYLFISKKMYEKTWIPLMCIVYAFGVYVLVFLGRSNDWEWFSSEWYNVHLKLSCASCVWILAYSINSQINKLITLAGGIFLIIGCGIYGNMCAITRAPHVRAYYIEKQKYLFVENIDNMPVDNDGITPLLHDLDVTITGINILKKWNLSVYQFWDSYNASPDNTGKEPVKYIQGKYDDGWAEDIVVIQINSLDVTNIIIQYYSLADQTLTVSFNDNSDDISININEGNGWFEIPCSASDNLTITLSSTHIEQLNPPDLRMASYYIEHTSY